MTSCSYVVVAYTLLCVCHIVTSATYVYRRVFYCVFKGVTEENKGFASSFILSFVEQLPKQSDTL